MKRILLLLMIISCCMNLIDVNTAGAVSPVQDGMGGTCLARYNNSSVQLANPALLELIDRTSMALDYRRQYDLAELDLITLAISHDLGIFNLGLTFSNYGETDFWAENMITSSLSKTVFSNISLGVRIEYHRISFDERFWSLDMTSIGVGMAYIDDDFVIHASLSDINSPRYSDYDRKTEPGYRIGASITSISPVVMNIEVAGRDNNQQRFSFGQEINFEGKLFLRFGLITNPTLPSAGFGLMLDRFRLDYSINRHNVLGDSHCLGISVSL